MSKDKIRNKVQELAKKYGYYFIDGCAYFTSEDRWYICYPYYEHPLNYDYLTDALFSSFIAYEKNGKKTKLILYDVVGIDSETVYNTEIKNVNFKIMEKHLQKNLKKLKELKTENKIKEIDKDFE